MGPAKSFPVRPHPHLLQLNTLIWLDELTGAQQKPLRLGSVPAAEWDRVADLGFDLVWLMGVWERSRLGRHLARSTAALYPAYNAALPGWTPSDVQGSPYAIKSYRPDPLIGGWQDLEIARRQLHRRGIGLILDFIPNHTGRDHPWVQCRPDYYIQGSMEDYISRPDLFFPRLCRHQISFIAKGKDPYFPAWEDTAQLNLFHPGLRRALIEELKRLSNFCDGVRCDMAMLVLNRIFAAHWGGLAGTEPPLSEFWSEAVEAVPGWIWIAEAYWDTEAELHRLGFDYAYDKRLYDRLRGRNPAEIRAHLGAEIEYQSRLVRFLENHDEERAAHAFAGDMGRAAAVLAAASPGLRFFHQGQLEGRRVRIPVQLARAQPEPFDAGIHDFYRRLLSICGQSVFHQGRWTMLEAAPDGGDSSHSHCLAWLWRQDADYRLVLVNFSAGFSKGRLAIPADPPAGDSRSFQDLLSDHQIHGCEQESLPFLLQPFEARILAPARPL